MAINKVTYMGETLIDLTQDTVTADMLGEGVIAHGANGDVITGTAVIGEGGTSINVEPLAVTKNGTYTAPEGTAYSPIEVNVASSSGDTSSEDGLIDGTITECRNDRVTSIRNGAFKNCFSLTTVSFPNVTSIGNEAFGFCSSLTTIDFPEVTTLGIDAFSSCAITTASFPKLTSINATAFRNCTNLTKLYLLGSSVCFLYSSNVFVSTPIGGYSTVAGTYGSIYVPASLLTAYQSANNWSYFSSRFVGV